MSKRNKSCAFLTIIVDDMKKKCYFCNIDNH